MAEESSQMAHALKMAQMSKALKELKGGGDGSSNSSSAGGGNSDALADALSKLGTQLASRNGTDGASGTGGTMMDNGETDFNRQRTLLGDRANQEMESAKLQARLDADRRKQSLGSAMASLSRFRS